MIVSRRRPPSPQAGYRMVWLAVFFNDTATTEIYTLSLHDALPIWRDRAFRAEPVRAAPWRLHRLPAIAAARLAVRRRPGRAQAAGAAGRRQPQGLGGRGPVAGQIGRASCRERV